MEFQNVTKIFGSEGNTIKALDSINLKVNKGEIFGIIGFSGAGKSTLIRSVNLLSEPTSGQILVNGQDLTKLNSQELRIQRKKIGMIFQHFNLLNAKTVFENVATPLYLLGKKRKEIQEKVKSLLEFVGLEDQGNKYPDQLSGGQKQRVGIARALATNPEILLCDEATSALDPETTSSILRLLKRINAEYNITILLITHEMNVIKQICDSVAVMEDGRIIEQGKVFDLFTNPQTKIAERFVSSVVQVELPTSFLQSIAGQNQANRICRIVFTGASAGSPLLSRVSKKFDVEVNVLSGQITELQSIPFGNIIVEFIGNSNEVDKAISFIQKSDVFVKEVLRNAG